MLRSRDQAARSGSARNARRPVSCALRADARRDREPARLDRGVLCVRSQCGVRVVPAHDLPSPQGAARRRARRVVPPWHVGVLPARARHGERVAAYARRMRALFVCVENAGRSQMAAALYERRGGEARSAGSRPAAELHEAVVEALEEVGIDVSGRTPRALSRQDVEWADLVVTMGCGDACPVLPGKEYVDWNLPDPAGLCLEDVRELRAVIEQRVSSLPL